MTLNTRTCCLITGLALPLRLRTGARGPWVRGGGALQCRAGQQPRPLLAGRLKAQSLWLADLGPGPQTGGQPRPPSGFSTRSAPGSASGVGHV